MKKTIKKLQVGYDFLIKKHFRLKKTEYIALKKGMFGKDMMAKMEEMKRASDESKARLDSIIVEGESGGGLIRIELTGNRQLKSVQINGDHRTMEKEDLEDLITVALNRAMESANNLNESEVMNSAKNIFPGF